MASARSLAIRRETALAALAAAAAALAATLDLPPLVLPSNRNAEMADILRLEAITAFLRTAQAKPTTAGSADIVVTAATVEMAPTTVGTAGMVVDAAPKPTRKGKG